MDAKAVRKLEGDIAEAIAAIMMRRSKEWQVPLLPSQWTMHLMAKAAVAVYEAVAEEARPRSDQHSHHGPKP